MCIIIVIHTYLAILCTTKVNELDDASGVHHYVSTFDVSVDDVVAMDIEECVRDLSCIVGYSVAVQ